MIDSWTPYCGAAPVPAEWLARWNLDPVLIGGLALIALVLWQRAAFKGRLGAALAIAVLLFVSPLCALSSALFSVRVTHHILLTGLIAPLAVAAFPRLRVPGSAPLWTLAHAALFWLWHAPQPYSFALSSDAAYWLMQFSLLGSALGFWASLRQSPAPLAIGLLLGFMVQMGLLGALITFAGSPLYAPHYLTTVAWGFSPIEDQQLAGILMWAPASALYLGAAMVLGWRALGQPRQVPA